MKLRMTVRIIRLKSIICHEKNWIVNAIAAGPSMPMFDLPTLLPSPSALLSARGRSIAGAQVATLAGKLVRSSSCNVMTAEALG